MGSKSKCTSLAHVTKPDLRGSVPKILPYGPSRSAVGSESDCQSQQRHHGKATTIHEELPLQPHNLAAIVQLLGQVGPTCMHASIVETDCMQARIAIVPIYRNVPAARHLMVAIVRVERSASSRRGQLPLGTSESSCKTVLLEIPNPIAVPRGVDRANTRIMIHCSMRWVTGAWKRAKPQDLPWPCVTALSPKSPFPTRSQLWLHEGH